MTETQAGLRRSLGTVATGAIAAASIAATTSIGVGMGALAAAVGNRGPAVLLLAFVPILGIAVAFSRLNRVEPNCGNGYTWVRTALGPWLGFVTGWINLAGSVIYGAYATALTGSVILQFAGQAGLTRIGRLTLNPDSTLQSTLLGFVVVAAAVWFAITGIRHVAGVQTALLVFEYAVLLVFSGWALVKGTHAFQWSWLSPVGVAGLAQGLVVAVYFYWGWDSAFGVTEETRGSRETSRGGYLSLFVTLGLFLYCAVALQRMMSVSELVNDGPQAITLLGSKLAKNPVALLPPLALLASAVSSLQAGLVPTVRGAFAMGRDRTLGRVWGKVSPRYGTPVAGTLIIAAASALIAVGSMAITALSQVVIAVADSIGLIVSLYYGITAVACAVRFRSVRGLELLPSVVLPALSGACLLGTGGYLGYQYATMSSGFAFNPGNGWFLLAVPAAIIASGFGMAAVAKWGRKSPYFGRASQPAAVTVATSA